MLIFTPTAMLFQARKTGFFINRLKQNIPGGDGGDFYSQAFLQGTVQFLEKFSSIDLWKKEQLKNMSICLIFCPPRLKPRDLRRLASFISTKVFDSAILLTVSTDM